MSKTRKDTVKALKKASRKNNPLPQGKIIPDKKKAAKKNPPKERYEDYIEDWRKDT